MLPNFLLTGKPSCPKATTKEPNQTEHNFYGTQMYLIHLESVFCLTHDTSCFTSGT